MVNKLQRFAEIKAFDHVFEYTEFQSEQAKKPKGRWKRDIFKNKNPITLELACGKGTYTTELARLHPNKNFVGVDIKGARLWKGAKRAKKQQLDNVRFLRMYIDHLEEYFAPEEIAEIWITFPDPYPRKGDAKKRLTSPKFLKKYQQVLAKDGTIHFKTDDSAFFEYTCQTIYKSGGHFLKRVEHIYRDCPDDPILTVKTDFEKKHLKNNKTISYCSFRLPSLA